MELNSEEKILVAKFVITEQFWKFPKPLFDSFVWKTENEHEGKYRVQVFQSDQSATLDFDLAEVVNNYGTETWEKSLQRKVDGFLSNLSKS